MDTVTNKFIESFSAGLVPKLEERFGALESVTVYEDYLSDGFLTDGIFRLPVTLEGACGVRRVFCSFRVDKRNFEDMIPYSYKGASLIEFKIEESGCQGLEARLEGRAYLPKKDAIKLNVDATSRDKTFLSGKYSQTFIDLMAYEITREIEKEFSVTGASESTLELHLSFAPGTFMEHASESTSYRRLRISARSCAPRDLWIKWTRLDGCGTYTVGDHVGEGKVRFEIADEVPQRIREKEYRYIMATESPDAYRAAMSRKNFTEWRELIKRTIKRGEMNEVSKEEPQSTLTEEPKEPVIQPTAPEDSSPVQNELPDVKSIDLQALLDNYGEDTDEAKPEEEEEINPDLQALLLSVINRQKDNTDAPVSENIGESVPTAEESDGDDEPPFDISDEPDPLSILAELGASSDADEGVLPEVIDAEENEPTPEEPQEDDPTPSPVPPVSIDDFDYDNRRREELLSLTRERDELRESLEALKKLMVAKDAEIKSLRDALSEKSADREDLKTELATLREELAAKRREEEREKDRIASLARQAVESQLTSTLDAEDIAREERLAQEKRLEEERLEAERIEAERLEAERLEAERLEAERIEAEKREADRLMREAEEKAALEREAAAKAVRYVSKTADIFFRYPVDPNITKKIQEIIVSTVKYFEKEDVYMKVKATIPESKTVRLEFLEIPDSELALLTDIIRVLGHSKLGITRVLLD